MSVEVTPGDLADERRAPLCGRPAAIHQFHRRETAEMQVRRQPRRRVGGKVVVDDVVVVHRTRQPLFHQLPGGRLPAHRQLRDGDPAANWLASGSGSLCVSVTFGAVGAGSTRRVPERSTCGIGREYREVVLPVERSELTGLRDGDA